LFFISMFCHKRYLVIPVFPFVSAFFIPSFQTGPNGLRQPRPTRLLTSSNTYTVIITTFGKIEKGTLKRQRTTASDRHASNHL
jgi:hypothetical protein